MLHVFFFSSRRRHTRSLRDWSSDVCSSDLFVKSLKPPLKLSLPALETLAVIAYKQPVTGPEIMEIRGVQGGGVLKTLLDRKRSEERRVGKEGRCRGRQVHARSEEGHIARDT